MDRERPYAVDTYFSTARTRFAHTLGKGRSQTADSALLPTNMQVKTIFVAARAFTARSAAGSTERSRAQPTGVIHRSVHRAGRACSQTCGTAKESRWVSKPGRVLPGVHGD